MKHRYKTKNTVKETAESEEDEEELLKDRREPSDPKSQEDPEEEDMVVAEVEGDTNDPPQTRDIRFKWMCKKRRKASSRTPPPLKSLLSVKAHTPPSSAVAPPCVHHGFQETVPQFKLEKPGSVTKEQGIKPSSLCDRLYHSVDSASYPIHSSDSGSQFISDMRLFESPDEHEPLSDFDVTILDHQDQPSFNYSSDYSSYEFEGQGSKQTDQRSMIFKPTEISDLLPVSPYHGQVRYESHSDPSGSDLVFLTYARGSSPPQPQDVNVCERLNSEVSQTKAEISSDSSAEPNEGSEQLGDDMQEVRGTEAVETAEDWRPVQSSLVPEDIQDEQRSRKFSPEENIGIFYPKMPLLPLLPMTDSQQQHRHVVHARTSVPKCEGRRRKHDLSSPTFLSCGLQLQGHGGLELDPSLRGRVQVHPGQASQPLGEESLPRPPFSPVFGSPSFFFSGFSNLNVNDPFQHLNLKKIKKEKIKAPGSNESDTEPNISHSRPSVTALPPCSQSSIPTVSGPPECSNEERVEEAESRVFLLQAESTADHKVSVAAASPVRAEYVSATYTLPPSSHLQVSSSCCLTRFHSAPSLSKIPKKNFRRAASLPDMKLKEFTPAISADDGDDETYSFQCSCPGLYQCSVSGLVFTMKGQGGVAYRTVPWNRRLLAQHHKKPAGPLFAITCLQRSVCQLHLPHCEIISTGGGRSLQVAHVSDEGIDFISPHQVTQTHVVVNISGFSAYGNVKDEDSPPDPVRALVLLFYKPPEDPDLRSVLSVLLLPRNVVFHKIQCDRRKLDKNERYVETSPHCCLHPKQVYALSTSPEDDLVKVQPKEAEFDDEYHESYFPSFQVVLKRVLTDVNLTLRDSSSSSCVWEREVCLLPSGVKTLDTGPKKRPSPDLRSCFIRRISGPVLSSLLDQLLEKRVITGAEREAADTKQSRSDRARFVFDTVSNKGEAARSEMMEFLCEEDPFLCEHLGLKQNGEKAS